MAFEADASQAPSPAGASQDAPQAAAATHASAAVEAAPEAPPPEGSRNTSSAMPDPGSSDVPTLKAQVHQQISVEECSRIPLSALNFRALKPSDHDEMLALHQEWFPVSYNDAFYTKSVEGAYYTLVATYRSGSTRSSANGSANGSQNGVSAAAPQGSDGGEGSGGADHAADEEHLLGMITMSTVCEHHCEDITSVLGDDCETICRSVCPPPKDKEDSEGNRGVLAYILTLGVAEGFRRRGLARELLRHLDEHVQREMPLIQAIYLHVVTYNEAAIHLYESMQYQRIGHFPSFYQLHGKPYDSFLYARYVHNGRPPWAWRWKKMIGLNVAAWKDWIVSTFSSLWRDRESEMQEDRTTALPQEGP